MSYTFVTVQCKPTNGSVCNNRTKNPTGRCHIHASSTTHNQKSTGRAFAAPPRFGNSAEPTDLVTEQAMEFQQSLMALYPDAIVTLDKKPINDYVDITINPTKDASFWQRPALKAGDVVELKFTDDSLDIKLFTFVDKGPTKPLEKTEKKILKADASKIDSAFESVYFGAN